MATLKNTTINDTGFIRLPNGTTAQRPASPQAGMMRFNTDSSAVEIYNPSNAAWQRFSTGTASTLPVAGATLWFDSASLATYSDGQNINLWENKGSLGSTFNLVQNQTIGNSSGTPNYPIKQTINGRPCCYFDGGSNRVLYFNGFQSNPGSGSGVYLFDGNSGGGVDPNNRTIFYVYYTTSGTISAFGTNNGNYSSYGYGHSYGNVGFWSNNYVIIESNDGFPIGSSTGVTFDSSVIAQAGHRQGPSVGNTVSVWKNRSPGFSTFSWSNSSAQTNPVGIGYARASAINNGYIFEIITYDTALSDSEINTIRTYLGTKYGGTANS